MTELTTAVEAIRQALDTAPMYERRNGKAALTMILDALEEKDKRDAMWATRVDAAIRLSNRHVEQADAAEAQLAMAMETISQVEALLTNLQPHIQQACYPGHSGFIDNYVDPALDLLRTPFLPQGEKP